MAEAVAVLRAKKQAAAAAAAEAEGEARASLSRSKSLLEEKFDEYEAANYRMWMMRSKSDGAPSPSTSSAFLTRLVGTFAPATDQRIARAAHVPLRPSGSVTWEIDGDSARRDDDGGARTPLGAGGEPSGEGETPCAGLGNERAGENSSSCSSSLLSADEDSGLLAKPFPLGSRRREAPPAWQVIAEGHVGGDGGGNCANGGERSWQQDANGLGGGAEGGEGEVGGDGGAGGGEAKAAGRLLRSLTEDTTGKSMAVGASMAVGGSMAVGASMGVNPHSDSGTLHDAEMEEMDGEVLQEAFHRVFALEKRVQHYRDLGGFTVLMALFITILYMQADSSRSYEITQAHTVLYPPGMTQDTSNSFSGAADFYEWLNTSIVQSLWADPTCGDGTCWRPFQYPAFGRFGCEADCGVFPNLTSVVIRFSSQLDTQEALQESSWNLCMTNPVSLCWYSEFQPFPAGEVEFSASMAIPDGDWVVAVNAPYGGVRGTLHAPLPGMQRLDIVGSASTVEVAAWGYCTHDDDLGAANQTGLSSAAAAAPDVCRDTCVALAACLPMACNRSFTEREVAGAFVDCARMCVVSPATITAYSTGSCPVSDMASIFTSTQCDSSSSATRPPANSTAHTSRPARRKALSRSHHHRSHHHRSHQHPPHSYVPAPTSVSRPPRASSRRVVDASPSSGVVGRALAASSAAAAPAQQAQAPPPSPPPAVPAAAAAAAATAHSAAAATADAPATLAATLAAAPSSPSLWSLLGSTDRQRITALQVAVSRALFSVAKDRCLAGIGPGSEARHLEAKAGSVRNRIVACMCVIMGGPALEMEECRFTNETGHVMVDAEGMFGYLQRTHVKGGRVISSQHMRRYVQVVVAAMQSVTPMTDASTVLLSALLHAFDDAIVTSDAEGCSQGHAWLAWRAGVSHNTTIHAGDKVTWVWADDHPHSLRVAGMGEAPDPLFHGFGGHRLAVSRKLPCTPMNAGMRDTTDEPLPCVLSAGADPSGWFAYTKQFNHPATVFYEDGSLPAGAQDTLSPSSSSSAFPSSSSSSFSSSSASVLTVLPPRTGADATAHSTTVNTTATSSTTLFTPPSTAAPTPSSSASPSSASSSALTTYFCAPGCKLQRVANGVCDAACNTPSCAFDGGDCACVDPLFGPGVCPCPIGHTRRDDGSCCLSTAVGLNLNFPFSLHRYGPNYTETNQAFAAERSTAANRFVSGRNRLLIGMVLQQDRWGTQACSGQGILHLAGWCSNGTSSDPFGVNPHFLPSSSLYDGAEANMSQMDNSSFGAKLQFNPQGLPYGFIYPIENTPFYPLVFDINLDNEAATRRLQYLVDGSYIDNGTRSIAISFITFNGESRTFVLTTVRCAVGAGGSMAVTFKSQPAAMTMYEASAEHIALLVLEVLYLLGLLWNVYGEVQELLDRAHMDGSVLSYFGLAWNWVDMISLASQFTAVILWVVLWRYVDAFDMAPRYDIYYTLLEMPRYWATPNPPTGFLSASQAFLDLRNIIKLRAVYFALQGINLFFMMVRLLKFMDFQPYLGIITRSLALATPSLLHFFLLSFAVFFCFSMYGYLVFGGAIEQFSTVLTSMFSCFLLLLNDNSSAYFFQRLESWDLIAAMLFFFMFIVIMVFILLNFLIAIIVDAFMSVKDSNVVATSITADLAHIFKYKWNCWRGRYLPYRTILNQLVELGARDTRLDEAGRRMRRYKLIQRRVRSVFSSRPARRVPDPTLPAASTSMVRKQRVLTVRDKRIDTISLSMILQRQHDKAFPSGHAAEPSSKRPFSSSGLHAPWHNSSAHGSTGSLTPHHVSGSPVPAEDLSAAVECLSQALVLQCGEVVRQEALPVKKPVQKLSLAQIKEEVVRSQQAVEELRGMMDDVRSEVRCMAVDMQELRTMMLQLISRTSAATPGGAAAATLTAAAAATPAAAPAVSASMPHPARQPFPSHASTQQSPATQLPSGRQPSKQQPRFQAELQPGGRNEGGSTGRLSTPLGGGAAGQGSGGNGGGDGDGGGDGGDSSDARIQRDPQRVSNRGSSKRVSFRIDDDN